MIPNEQPLPRHERRIKRARKFFRLPIRFVRSRWVRARMNLAFRLGASRNLLCMHCGLHLLLLPLSHSSLSPPTRTVADKSSRAAHKFDLSIPVSRPNIGIGKIRLPLVVLLSFNYFTFWLLSSPVLSRDFLFPFALFKTSYNLYPSPPLSISFYLSVLFIFSYAFSVISKEYF